MADWLYSRRKATLTEPAAHSPHFGNDPSRGTEPLVAAQFLCLLCGGKTRPCAFSRDWANCPLIKPNADLERNRLSSLPVAAVPCLTRFPLGTLKPGRSCFPMLRRGAGSTGQRAGERALPSHAHPPYGHGAFGAVSSSSLTSDCAPATPASRTSRSPQFSVDARGHRQKIGSPACRKAAAGAVLDPSRL